MTRYKRLFIWVEGPDDERFFNGKIYPLMTKRYDNVAIVKYQDQSLKWRKDFLRSIRSITGADYIFVKDINSRPCVTAKKQEIKRELRGCIDEDKIIIVIKEIESWFMAGLNKGAFKKLKIKHLTHTNDLTKEVFDGLMPIRFTSRIEFMQEILNLFSMKTAKTKNGSFKYFTQKYKM